MMPKILDAIEYLLEKDDAGSLSLVKIFCLKCELFPNEQRLSY